jgi:hypothetical protein
LQGFGFWLQTFPTLLRSILTVLLSTFSLKQHQQDTHSANTSLMISKRRFFVNVKVKKFVNFKTNFKFQVRQKAHNWRSFWCFFPQLFKHGIYERWVGQKQFLKKTKYFFPGLLEFHFRIIDINQGLSSLVIKQEH